MTSDPYAKYRVTVPVGECRGVTVSRFTVEQNSLENLRLARDGRATRGGEYTRIADRRGIWMSDTDAEIRDRFEAIWRIQRTETRRVLINGLGLGLVLKVAIDAPHIEHVDVVEIDDRVIELVGPNYACGKLTIHHADACEQARKWKSGTRWCVAWHDIWRDLCEDNLPEMARLHRSYGRRVDWQGSCGKWLLESRKRQYAGRW